MGERLAISRMKGITETRNPFIISKRFFDVLFEQQIADRMHRVDFGCIVVGI
jgi:hypothetical protein